MALGHLAGAVQAEGVLAGRQAAVEHDGEVALDAEVRPGLACAVQGSVVVTSACVCCTVLAHLLVVHGCGCAAGTGTQA